MAHEDVGTSIHHRVREGDQEADRLVPSCAWIVTRVRSASRVAFLTTSAISSTSSGFGSVLMPGWSPTTKRRPKKLSASPAADPFAPYGLKDPSDVEATNLAPIEVWIRNDAGEASVIRADAGAGAVLVDTVAAGDSVRVRLETTADSVLLTSTGLSGAHLGEEWVWKSGGARRAVFP